MAPDALRPGSAAAASLWKINKSDYKKWSEALEIYSECVDSVSKAQSKAQTNLSKYTFTEDDIWKEKQLPKLLKSQNHINLKQLERLMQWKLRRGMFRPTLMGLVRRNENQKVIEVSKSGFDAAHLDVCEGMEILCKLQGVGPATASAILSVYLPMEVPFMSDEAMDAVVGLPRLYTKAQFAQFKDAVIKKAKTLGPDWSPDRVEKALWCTAMISKYEH